MSNYERYHLPFGITIIQLDDFPTPPLLNEVTLMKYSLNRSILIELLIVILYDVFLVIIGCIRSTTSIL